MQRSATFSSLRRPRLPQAIAVFQVSSRLLVLLLEISFLGLFIEWHKIIKYGSPYVYVAIASFAILDISEIMSLCDASYKLSRMSDFAILLVEGSLTFLFGLGILLQELKYNEKPPTYPGYTLTPQQVAFLRPKLPNALWTATIVFTALVGLMHLMLAVVHSVLGRRIHRQRAIVTEQFKEAQF